MGDLYCSVPAEKTSARRPKKGGGGAAISTWYSQEMGNGRRATRSSVRGHIRTPSPG